jgi:hypothetical protein
MRAAGAGKLLRVALPHRKSRIDSRLKVDDMQRTAEIWMEMLMSSAELAGRMAEMTAVSAYVITRRSWLLALEPNDSRKRREYNRMIREKFLGGGESVVATWRALFENYPLLARSMVSTLVPLAGASTPAADFNQGMPRLRSAIGTICAASAIPSSTAMHIGIFLSTVGLKATAPLHRRVVANMERLSGR